MHKLRTVYILVGWLVSSRYRIPTRKTPYLQRNIALCPRAPFPLADSGGKGTVKKVSVITLPSQWPLLLRSENSGWSLSLFFQWGRNPHLGFRNWLGHFFSCVACFVLFNLTNIGESLRSQGCLKDGPTESTYPRN